MWVLLGCPIDEAGEAGRLLPVTIEIIKEVIARHPLSLLAEDEGAALRGRAAAGGAVFQPPHRGGLVGRFRRSGCA